MKWKTIEDFIAEYHGHIRDLVFRCHPDQEEPWAEEVITLGCMLWNEARHFANRTPLSLAVDCVYVLSRMAGQRVSVTLMESHTLDLFGQSITPMRAKGIKWNNTERGKAAILSVCGPAEDLYQELITNVVVREEE